MDNSPKPPEDPRVRMAGERTFLAWIRTGLAMMGFGFVVARFGLFLREIAAAGHAVPHDSTGLSLLIGTAMVVLGVAVTVLAAVQHFRFLRRIERGEPYRPSKLSLGLVVAAVLAAIGLAMTAYLLAVGQ
jgi:putative membrane protein